MLEDGDKPNEWSPDYCRQVLEAREAKREDIEYKWKKMFQEFVDLGGKR